MNEVSESTVECGMLPFRYIGPKYCGFIGPWARSPLAWYPWGAGCVLSSFPNLLVKVGKVVLLISTLRRAGNLVICAVCR